MNEKQLADMVLGQLEPNFYIDREVPGRHFSGKTFRLDAVVRPKDPSLWLNQGVAMGVEFKDVLRLRGCTRNFTRWLGQCVDYSNTCWGSFGYLHIFACPGLLDGIPMSSQSRSDVERVLKAVLGQLGIGELPDLPRYGRSFILHSQHRIWSMARGVESGKHYSLAREFGSR